MSSNLFMCKDLHSWVCSTYSEQFRSMKMTQLTLIQVLLLQTSSIYYVQVPLLTGRMPRDQGISTCPKSHSFASLTFIKMLPSLKGWGESSCAPHILCHAHTSLVSSWQNHVAKLCGNSRAFAPFVASCRAFALLVASCPKLSWLIPSTG